MNKPKSNRKKYITKPRVGKKLIISTVASVMAVTIASSLIWNAMKVSVPVEANTLSGIDAALKDHGSGEAFVILDIVPGTVSEGVSLGTMGDLTSGQSQLEQYITGVFKSDPDTYSSYQARKEEAEILAGSYANDDFKYLESPFKENSTWSEVYAGESFDPGASFDEDEALEGYWSIVKGRVTPAENGEYKLISELPGQTMILALDETSYKKSNEPLYEGYSLYSSEILNDENISQYDDDTPIYEIDDEGNYNYISTIAEYIANKDERAENLEGYKEKIEENNEEIKSYEEKIADLQKKYDDLNQQLEELKQQTPQGESEIQETKTEDGSTGEDSTGDDTIVSLNWVKFSETDPLSDEEVIENSEPEVVDEINADEVTEPGGENVPDEGNEPGGENVPVEGNEPGGENVPVEGNEPGGENVPDEGNEPGGENVPDEVTEPGGENVPDEGTEPGGKNVPDEGTEPGGENIPDEGTEPDDETVIDGETETDSEPGTGDQSEELKQKQEELEQLNEELEQLNAKLEELKNEQDALQDELKELEEEPEEEYYAAVFEHEIVKKGGEPISGLYLPNKSETVPLEKPAMFALEADDDPLLDIEVSEENKLVYVGTGNGGTHTITRDSSNAGENILLFGAPVFIRCYHEDLLKEYVFCNSGLNIKIDVKAAAKVSVEDVMNADLIYLEDVEGRDNVQYLYSDFDMSPSVVFSIIDRAVNDYTPVIVNKNVSTGGGNGIYNDSNYQKLGSILSMSDFPSFFLDMEEDVESMLINAGSGEYGRRTEANYVNNNIYVVDSSGTLSARGSFNEEFTDEEMGGFEEVKSAIDMENKQGNDLPGPSKAMAIQYIINFANGFIGEFRDFSILELQPTSGETDLRTRNDSRNNTILYWRNPGSSSSGQQIVRSSQLITITVNTESVAQFSGEQSDINDKYQMIFIGLDGQRLNYEGKDTVYNDSSLNGKIYNGVGDIADGDGQRYEGIDITPQKKNALLEFMQAGYPVVVENNFFVDKSAKDAGVGDINTDYIDSSSQMYDFLRIALSSDDYKWCLYTIADIHTHYSDFVAQINVHRPRIEFDTDNANSAYAQKVQTVSADAVDGKYRGYIAYKVTNDIGEYYDQSWNLRFYLDMNQDGRFDDTEDVTNDVAISNGVLMVEFTAPERGSIPWKLEVSDDGNRYRRDELTGYFNIYHSTQMPIRIVQVIGADSMDAGYNLQAAYEIMSEQALIGYYLKNAETLTNTKFDISTITVGQLAAELKDNVEYLSGVDVLVLGFGPDEYTMSVPVEGTGLNADWFVNKYISEGRGVLVSSAASSAASGRMQLDVGALGQKDTKTYNSLGRTKPSDFNYKYSNLESDMFDEWGFLSASRVNDGAISHYPYEIGVGLQLGGGNVKIADYVLDLENNGQSGTAADVTAWYTLGNVSLWNTKTSYGASVDDAANNYYIYSKGNVVYVGSNAYPYTYDGTGGAVPAYDTEGTDDCRLFVNALMEAYTVGIKNPKVTIVAGLADDSAEADSICIPYDEQIKEIEETDGDTSSNGILDDTVDVYFKVSEPNFAFRKDVTLAFYYEDAAGGQVNVGGRIVNATQFASEIWTVEANQLVPVTVTTGLDLVPGKVYKIKAPVISLKNDADSVNADIYIVVQSHFTKLGQDRHPVGSDSVTLNRAQLFLLE